MHSFGDIIFNVLLMNLIQEFDHIVFEVHSKDYQTEVDLTTLIEDHFCILKVGQWLIFAYREALFSIESVEIEILERTYRLIKIK